MPEPERPFQVERFDKKQHSRTRFTCGKPELDHYIHRQVSADEKRNVARCYAAIHLDTPAELAGYYTLSAHSLEAEMISEDLSRTIPYSAIPSVLLGRLAVHEELQGSGLGRFLVAHAITQVLELRDKLGIKLIVVDPLGEDLTAFYTKLGFQEIETGQFVLLVDMAAKAYGQSRDKI